MLSYSNTMAYSLLTSLTLLYYVPITKTFYIDRNNDAWIYLVIRPHQYPQLNSTSTIVLKHPGMFTTISIAIVSKFINRDSMCILQQIKISSWAVVWWFPISISSCLNLLSAVIEHLDMSTSTIITTLSVYTNCNSLVQRNRKPWIMSYYFPFNIIPSLLNLSISGIIKYLDIYLHHHNIHYKVLPSPHFFHPVPNILSNNIHISVQCPLTYNVYPVCNSLIYVNTS